MLLRNFAVSCILQQPDFGVYLHAYTHMIFMYASLYYGNLNQVHTYIDLGQVEKISIATGASQPGAWASHGMLSYLETPT